MAHQQETRIAWNQPKACFAIYEGTSMSFNIWCHNYRLFTKMPFFMWCDSACHIFSQFFLGDLFPMPKILKFFPYGKNIRSWVCWRVPPFDSDRPNFTWKYLSQKLGGGIFSGHLFLIGFSVHPYLCDKDDVREWER